MTKKQKRERMSRIVEQLKEIYPDATCALQWEGEPWRLLVMGMLSAQCTDARVNLVCEELFRVYPTACDLANAPRATYAPVGCIIPKQKTRKPPALCWWKNTAVYSPMKWTTCSAFPVLGARWQTCSSVTSITRAALLPTRIASAFAVGLECTPKRKRIP